MVVLGGGGFRRREKPTRAGAALTQGGVKGRERHAELLFGALGAGRAARAGAAGPRVRGAGRGGDEGDEAGKGVEELHVGWDMTGADCLWYGWMEFSEGLFFFFFFGTARVCI